MFWVELMNLITGLHSQRLSRLIVQYRYDFIVSPFSVWCLLTLMAEGASGNTYSQLANVLRLPNDLHYIRQAYHHVQKALVVNTTTVELSVIQALFSDVNRPLDSEYNDKLENIYHADHVPVNFYDTAGAYNQINSYVDRQTHGKITKIVNTDDLRDAQMVLISSIFFKGQWKVSG